MTNLIQLEPETHDALISDIEHYYRLRWAVSRSVSKQHNFPALSKKYGLSTYKIRALWNAYIAKGRL